MTTCYSVSVQDAVTNKYDLSKAVKEKYRFIDLDQFLTNRTFKVVQFEENGAFGGIPKEAQPYAALSYPWRDLTPLAVTDVSKNSFRTVGLGNDEPPTSLDILVAVCTAAKQEGCRYLWMDKLSFRQDYDQQGIDDRAWQMKRMYSIYEKCKVCLVAAGGMVRLPRLIDRTSWINRAWTLQEALAPAEVKCLFSWDSGDKVINGGNMASSAQPVLPGVAMASLGFLLTANLHADAPLKVKEKDGRNADVERIDLPKDPDSQVYCFGYGNEDNNPITALLGALERPNPTATGETAVGELSSRRLGIWRCITMRSARYAEDFVFATMGIFGVTVDPLIDGKGQIRKEGYLEYEIHQLLDNYLIALAKINARADWFAVAPELGPARVTSALPLVPDINFTKDGNGRLATPVKSLLTYWDRFNWYLQDALKYTVDAPSGIRITALAHRVAPASNSPSGSAASSRRVLSRAHDLAGFELTDVQGGDNELYALAIGSKARYTGGSFPPLHGDKDATLLMLVEYMPFTMQRFRNIGYIWVEPGFTNGWQEKTIGVGLRGG